MERTQAQVGKQNWTKLGKRNLEISRGRGRPSFSISKKFVCTEFHLTFDWTSNLGAAQWSTTQKAWKRCKAGLPFNIYIYLEQLTASEETGPSFSNNCLNLAQCFFRWKNFCPQSVTSLPLPIPLQAKMLHFTDHFWLQQKEGGKEFMFCGKKSFHTGKCSAGSQGSHHHSTCHFLFFCGGIDRKKLKLKADWPTFSKKCNANWLFTTTYQLKTI